MIDVYPFVLTKEGKEFRFEFTEEGFESPWVFRAHVTDDLNWEEILKKLHNLPAGQTVLAYLDLGLTEQFSLEDDLAFKSYMLAIDHFVRKVLVPYGSKIAGILLYQGSALFETIGSCTEEGILPASYPTLFTRSFCSRLVAAYVLGMLLHRLVSFFPDGYSIFALFEETSSMSSLEKAILFSLERFEHIHLIFEHDAFQYPALSLDANHSPLGCFGKRSPSCPLAPLSLLLPSDEEFNREAYQALNGQINKLQSEGVMFRLIPEKIFNESWNELKTVFYVKSALHPMTLRMIRGFEASGGEAIEI